MQVVEQDKIAVLVIEDNYGDYRLIEEMINLLNHNKYILSHSNSLSEAFEFLSKSEVHVVLLDLGLPECKGIVSFNNFHEKFSDIPVVVLTGLRDESIGLESVQKGAQDYLVKGQVDEYLLTRSINYAIERKKTEFQFKNMLKEKELLLKEVNHRIKNNMSVICSLLNLQSGKIEDEKAKNAFKESHNRIRSMALIHEKLYKSKNLTELDFPVYISDLASDLLKTYHIRPGLINLKLNIGDIKLGIDKGIPCGLILNELISNALKYAFPENRKGKICVDFQRNKNQYQLLVADNGIGLSPELDLQNAESLGMRIVYSLVAQLNGTLEINNKIGTEFNIQLLASD